MNVNFLNAFSAFRKIFFCCECGGLSRLSDCQLIDQRAEEEMDWLQQIHAERRTLEKKLDKAESTFSEKRESIIEVEQKRAQAECSKMVEAVLPAFSKLKVNSNDVKPILNPVKFVSFDGLYDRDVRGVRFIDVAPKSKQEEKCLISLGEAIKAGNYKWATAHVNELGYVSIK